MLTSKMQFIINVLIQPFLSSICFDHLMFIIRNTILYMQLYMLLFMHLCKQSSMLEIVLDIQHILQPD